MSKNLINYTAIQNLLSPEPAASLRLSVIMSIFGVVVSILGFAQNGHHRFPIDISLFILYTSYVVVRHIV